MCERRLDTWIQAEATAFISAFLPTALREYHRLADTNFPGRSPLLLGRRSRFAGIQIERGLRSPWGDVETMRCGRMYKLDNLSHTALFAAGTAAFACRGADRLASVTSKHCTSAADALNVPALVYPTGRPGTPPPPSPRSPLSPGRRSRRPLLDGTTAP